MRRAGGWLTACVAVAVLGFPGGAAARPSYGQEAPAVSAPRADLGQLRSRVEGRFEVVVLRRGIVLVPKQKETGFNSVELADDGLVLIDGAPVTGRELRGRIPADAEVIAQLSFLDKEARRALFAPAAADPASASAPDAPADAAGQIDVSPPGEGWVERERYRRGGTRVRVGGDVWVKEDESVGDAVVAVFGTARVDGRVEGDVVAVLGSVRLGPRAVVRGDVVSVGGAVERARGSRVDGDINEVRVGFPAFGPVFHVRPWDNWRWFGSPFGGTTDLFATLLRMAIVGLFAAMIVALGAGPVRRVAGTAAADPWRAAVAGLAAQVFFVPVLVITVIVLAVSIIGIPILLLLPFALLAAVFALFMGLAGTGCAVGEALARRVGRPAPSLIASLVVGLALIWALTVIARFAGLAGQPVRFLIGFVLTVGFIVEYVAWTVGLGAVILSRFGRRGGRAMPPAPPVYDADGLPPTVSV